MRIDNKDIKDLFASLDWSTSKTSRAIKVEHILCYTLDLELSGDLEGICKIQFSNDPVQSLEAVSTWNDILYATLTKEASDNVLVFSAINNGFRFIRVNWVPSDGSGNLLKALYMEKGV